MKDQDDKAVHIHEYAASETTSQTTCGKVVPADQASRLFRYVTCGACLKKRAKR